MLYVIDFGASNDLLTVTVPTFVRADTGVAVTAPTIEEIGAGAYRFTLVWVAGDAPIFYVIHGTKDAGAINVDVRGVLRPEDSYLDKSITSAVTDLNTAVAAVGTAVANIDLDVAAVDTKVTNVATAVAAVNTAVADVDAAVVLVDARITDLDLAVAAVDAKVVAGNTAVAAVDTKVLAVDTKVLAVDTKVVAVDTSVAAVDTKIVGVSTAVAAVDTAVAGVNTAVSDVGAAVSNMGATVSSTAGAITAIQTETDKIGDAADLPTSTTVFGQLLKTKNDVRGAAELSLTDIAGAGFNVAKHSLYNVAESQIRMLGLVKENSYIDSTVFDGLGNMLQGRLRIYDSKVNADAAAQDGNLGTVGMLASYTIKGTYVGQNLKTYSVVRDS